MRGVMIANLNYDKSAYVSTLDKTWKEIHDCLVSGALCYIKQYLDERSVAMQVVTYAGFNDSNSKYEIVGILAGSGGGMAQASSYSTDSENGYPNDGDIV